MRQVVFLLICLAATHAAAADVLWDNNFDTNGSNGRAISPPGFPNIRLADDFVVPNGVVWELERLRYTALEDANWRWNDGDGIDITIYADESGTPGTIVAIRTPSGSKKSSGRTYFGRQDYHYWAKFPDDPIKLQPGAYWLGIRHSSGEGAGTNYWMTSDGGRDGKNSSTGYFKLGASMPWIPEGSPTWHHTFEISGRETPEPASLLLLVVGGLGLLRRRA